VHPELPGLSFSSLWLLDHFMIYYYHSARILVWSKIVTQSIIIEVKIRYKSMVDVHGNIVLLLCNCTHVVWLMVDLLTFATRQTALMCGVTVL